MKRLARLAVARPGRATAAWLTAIALLAGVGATVERNLNRTDLVIGGTESSRAAEITKKHFGESSVLPILLQGPRRDLDRQGRRLAALVEREPHVTVLTPWMQDTGDALRPRPDRVLLIARVDRRFDDASKQTVPAVRKILEREVSPPVEGHMSGYADIAAGIETASLDALKQAELIAAPLLMIFLLLIFRSPVAAALPLFLGLTTIGAARGLIAIVNETLYPLDAIALNFAAMFGLALGVDYSLLMVSRFREELAAGRDTKSAVLASVGTAGRTVKFAGFALGVTMIVGSLFAPGNMLASASIGGLIGVSLSVLGSVTVLPALLALIGTRINSRRFGAKPGKQGRWGALAWRSIRRPGLAAGLVLAALLALALPALALTTDSPDPRMLPESSIERRDAEAFKDALGAGWAGPYDIVIATSKGTVTEPKRLAAIESWQKDLARDRGVRAVLGPAAIAERTRPAREAPAKLRRLEGALAEGRRDQRRLEAGLEQVATGVSDMRVGLLAAAAGAGELRAGSDELSGGSGSVADGAANGAAGAQRLQAGMARAGAGAVSLRAGVATLRAGARRMRTGAGDLRDGTARALPGVETLLAGLEAGGRDLERLREPARTGQSSLERGLAAMDRMLPTSKTDPAYEQAYREFATALGALSGRDPVTGERVAEGYDGMDAALGTAAMGAANAAAGLRTMLAETRALHSGLVELEAGASRLTRGIEELDAGVAQVPPAMGALSAGAGRLAQGLAHLETGAGSLSGGVDRLGAGAAELEAGLRGGAASTSALSFGVGRLSDGAVAFRMKTDRLAGGLAGGQQLGPIFRSGYFTLAAIDGSAPSARTPASFAVNLDRGGTAARVVVVENGIPGADDALNGRLRDGAGSLARETGTDVAVGGPGSTLNDFGTETSGRLVPLLLALAIVTFLVLVPVLRSLFLPALAVILNVLTVLAALGVLVIGFQGSAPLGGIGYVDAIMAIGIATVVFGLSIDYEVFLLMRMREGWLLTGDTNAAVAHGLNKTASVITGAALIMTAVFASFATTDVLNLRQYGVGLTVGVLLDATLVRLVLLPAAIRLAGARAWWLPRWLDRLLPNRDAGRHEPPAGRPQPPTNGGGLPAPVLGPVTTGTAHSPA
jgi:RND superfamily putative drug exporter